jgi:signal transduction histidine kinase/CheY-like chemotaxis protein
MTTPTMPTPTMAPDAPHILVVEDSATQALSLAMLLEEAGYRATVARSGEQALALLPGDFALVLSDVVMPGMDGYALSRRIADSPWGEHLPVLLLTSLSEPLAIVKGLESGAAHFVTKPYEPERLLERVRRALAAPADLTGREAPVQVQAGGRTFTIAASRARVIDLLLSSYADLARTSEAERAAEQRARFLAEAGEKLSASLDATAVLRELARLAVPRLGDVSMVDFVGEDGQPRPVTVAEGDPPGAGTGSSATAWLAAPGAQAMDGGARLARADSGVPDAAGLRDVLALPMVARGATIGALAIGRRDGAPAWARQDVELALDLARRAAGAVDNARLYEAAQRATRSRDDMLAIVSHDLRNPLSTIQLSAQLMLDLHEEGAPVPIAAQVGVIRRSVDRAFALIQDLLDVSKIESSTLSVDLMALPAKFVLRELADEFRPLAEARGLTLSVEWTDAEDGTMLADRDRIGQVISNLVGNALKFTPAGGTVAVRGTCDGAWIRLSVRDSGVGIPAEHLPFLFDRFWQAHQHKRAGAGLGLFIAKGIVEAHGGAIAVESSPGAGTTFTFTVPAVAGRVAAAASDEARWRGQPQRT